MPLSTPGAGVGEAQVAGMQPCTLSVTGRCWASVGLTLKVTRPSLELLIISRAEQGQRLSFCQEWCL